MGNQIRVGVFGAAGRMGRTICAAVDADPDLDLVAGVDPFAAGEVVAGITVAKEAHAFADAAVQVAIDFTIVDAARSNAVWCATHAIHAVIGTSGFGDKDIDDLRHLFSGDGPNCVWAANFAIGAVLEGYLAAKVAPFFDTVEIVESHHDTKKDAPSSTAVDTARRIASANDKWAADPTEIESLPGARGARGAAGIPIHSMRMRGMIATQETVFGTTGQTLSIRHETYDRTSFMPGVLMATKAVADTPGLTLGLDALLGLT
ncbi:MAG TPA: 4-hydroxy-tetrahydrodipicolinate reductase [Acidimicrobiales bacterium]|nr:4-hydroxy-tetrahydrodipicolinate reductase [Acidimicrobiales bacterium]